MFCALVSLSVSGYSIAELSVRQELQTSTELSLLGITTFTITFGAAPLLIAPLSEVYGRSYIYLASSFLFAIFFIPQALARNIETILICRFISGIAGSSAVSLVGGTLSDVWRGPDRGFPMSFFSFAAFGCESIPVRRLVQADVDRYSYLSYWIGSNHVRLPRSRERIPPHQLDHVCIKHVVCYRPHTHRRRDSWLGAPITESSQAKEGDWRRSICHKGRARERVIDTNDEDQPCKATEDVDKGTSSRTS